MKRVTAVGFETSLIAGDPLITLVEEWAVAVDRAGDPAVVAEVAAGHRLEAGTEAGLLVVRLWLLVGRAFV